MNPEYYERANAYGFAPPLDILAALSRTDTVVLDVRTPDEIEGTGRLEGISGQWKSTGCTPISCPQLEQDPTQFVQDKEAPIVIYCASGRRAHAAQETLEKKGYKHAMNAGGYNDVMDMLKWQQRDNDKPATH
jgi:phage shock protein E